MKMLTVSSARRLTPRMARISFGGEGLDEFETWPDQQLKLCFPKPGHAVPRLDDADAMSWYQAFMAIPDSERPWMRSFTVRAHDPARHEIDVDFVLHGDAGPASRWALSAAPGDVIGRYGPDKVYYRPLGDADWYLFAGDETALPAIGSLLESLPERTSALVFVEVAAPEEELPLPGVHWLHRSAGESVVDAVSSATFPPSNGFAWLAGEAGAVRTMRRHLVGERGIDKKSIEFTGYWRRALTQDDAPTPEDMAEAQEKIATW
ncbi:siderophore-interacting protein [Lentzea tibetensis]|uniref:Siderophore-interacting protein n=1 Tax=Lentzea tibetensis TaxID=2591470 RepID=A0A563F319_9PSEU|nr:siderophore-interacting protein [Lentzea tibetensis]TWP54313.1 siderophore-interacting protein [Lentzea tibetensis]